MGDFEAVDGEGPFNVARACVLKKSGSFRGRTAEGTRRAARGTGRRKRNERVIHRGLFGKHSSGKDVVFHLLRRTHYYYVRYYYYMSK
jgi:hypothetical protein